MCDLSHTSRALLPYRALQTFAAAMDQLLLMAAGLSASTLSLPPLRFGWEELGWAATAAFLLIVLLRVGTRKKSGRLQQRADGEAQSRPQSQLPHSPPSLPPPRRALNEAADVHGHTNKRTGTGEEVINLTASPTASPTAPPSSRSLSPPPNCVAATSCDAAHTSPPTGFARLLQRLRSAPPRCLNPSRDSAVETWDGAGIHDYAPQALSRFVDPRARELLLRTAALHRFAAREFDASTGVYVGKTTRLARRFREHCASKPHDDEALLMVGLEEFPTELEALQMERVLTNALWCAGVPRYDREEPFGGKGKLRGHGPAFVYALVVVRGVLSEPREVVEPENVDQNLSSLRLPASAPSLFSSPAIAASHEPHRTAMPGSRAALPSARTPPSYVNKRGRPPKRTTEAGSLTARVAAMRRRGVATDNDSFWGPWPADGPLADAPAVHATDPLKGLAARVAALHDFARDSFACVVGVYVGKTMVPWARFDLHRREKLDEGEAIMMALLHQFPNQDQALMAERRLTDVLMALGVKRYEREEPFEGKGAVSSEDAPSFVYALVVVAEPRPPVTD